MDYSKRHHREKRHRKRDQKPPQSADFSSNSKTSYSSDEDECKHLYKDHKCHGHDGCRPKKCCKGKPGPTGPVGPTGAAGERGDTGATGSVAGLFGNGDDGNIDLCINPNAIPNPMDRDYYFRNLKVCGKLCTGGFRIFVRETLEFVNGAVICNDGGNGGPCTGSGAPLGTCGAGTNGLFAGKGVDADTPTIGGQGGQGKYPPGNLLPFTPSGGGPNLLNSFPQNVLGRDLNGVRISGGTGGGGDDGLPPNGIGATGGGGGAGVIIISAQHITGNGEIRARGGNGGTNGKSGGGGGGGIIINYSVIDTDDITINVAGGLGANGGTDGLPGSIYIVQV